MNEEIFLRIRNMFDVPQMQNSLRGHWVEAMVCEILGSGWKHTGADWAAWDLERDDGLRVEVKQSAKDQSWGPTTSAPRFSIRTAQGHYPEGEPYLPNTSGARLADVYIFAWHAGDDQRNVSQWQFYVVKADQLPHGQKTIGLAAIQELVRSVQSYDLAAEIARIGC